MFSMPFSIGVASVTTTQFTRFASSLVCGRGMVLNFVRGSRENRGDTLMPSEIFTVCAVLHLYTQVKNALELVVFVTV
jgi:hypothetical protein